MMGCRQKWNWSWNYLKLPLMESFQAFLCPIKLISALLWSVKVASSWIHIWTLTFHYQIIIGAKPTCSASTSFSFFTQRCWIFQFSSFASRAPSNQAYFNQSPLQRKSALLKRPEGALLLKSAFQNWGRLGPIHRGPSYLTRLKYSISNCSLFNFQYSDQTRPSFIGPHLFDVLEFTLINGTIW